MNPYNEANGECGFLTILDDGEDINGVHYDDFLCVKHHVWVDSPAVCRYCKAQWTKEQVYNFKEVTKR